MTNEEKPRWLKRSTDSAARLLRLQRKHIDVPPGTPLPFAFCPYCGAVLSSTFRSGDRCPACSEQVTETSDAPPGGENPHNPGCHEALGQETLHYTLAGWYVVRQRGNLIELRKRKRFNWTVVWATFAVGIPLPGWAVVYPAVYAVWHVVEKEKSMFLICDDSGQVRATKPAGQI